MFTVRVSKDAKSGRSRGCIALKVDGFSEPQEKISWSLVVHGALTIAPQTIWLTQAEDGNLHSQIVVRAYNSEDLDSLKMIWVGTTEIPCKWTGYERGVNVRICDVAISEKEANDIKFLHVEVGNGSHHTRIPVDSNLPKQ